MLQHAVIVHESQSPICELFFPFLRHKVGSEDVPRLQAVREENGKLVRMMGSVLAEVEADRELRR